MTTSIETETLDELEVAIRDAVKEGLEEGRFGKEAADWALGETELDEYKTGFFDCVENAMVQYVKEIVDDLERSFASTSGRCDS